MPPIELTALQLECLACALADPANEAAAELRQGTGASAVSGIVASLFVETGPARAALVNAIRLALDVQRTKCLEDATAAICPAARRACSA